jgi:hypothetical protein
MLFTVNLQALEKVGSERHQLGRGVRADDPEITDARLFQEVADLFRIVTVKAVDARLPVHDSDCRVDCDRCHETAPAPFL